MTLRTKSNTYRKFLILLKLIRRKMKILSKTSDFDFDAWYKRIEYEGGAVLIDKYKYWTSFDVIAKMRGILKTKKVGHAGTLDPLASGLMVVCIGRPATRLISTFENETKVYDCKLKLGYTTQTYDLERQEEESGSIEGITLEQIKEVLSSKFTGQILQTPPLFSAINIDGVRAYKLARKDSQVELPEREITIYGFSEIVYDAPFLNFSVECSKGTYIRSLANDIGKELACGAYLAGLRRTKSGDFSVDNAININDLRDMKAHWDETTVPFDYQNYANL